MKKVFYLTALLLAISFKGIANPGDTTWVDANNVQLNWYNNFDTTVAFPNGTTTYRKILMYFTLGEYVCPGNPQYCHQWDYTVQNYILTPTDTVEMCRFITPFATAGWPRFPSTWKQPYIFDVTDFAPLLKDSATVRIHYSGYSGGFTANVKFAFIEGIPDRNIVGIKKLYDQSRYYGNPAGPINSFFSTINATTPTGTKSAAMRVLVTGHGSDANQCCEFQSHSYTVHLNSSAIGTKTIWRDDCGLNNLYPQGGTWVYNRGNWCPGDKVTPNYQNLTGINAGGTPYNINMQFSNYTLAFDSAHPGSYTTSAVVIYYGDTNKVLDASLDAIIAPTDFPDYYRKNPSSSVPIVKVHNGGSTPITSITFKYGVKDSATQQYTWTGSIQPLKSTTINLQALNTLTNMSEDTLNGNYKFNVEILQVNNQTDDDSTNNKMQSKFRVAPTWPGDLILDLKTSNIGANGYLNSNPADASWKITDINGNVIYSRTNNNYSTLYQDTIAIRNAGFYKLTITTSQGYGLQWWAFTQGLGGYQSGYFNLKDTNGNLIPMKNYSYSGTPRHDFGSEYSEYFTVAKPSTLSIKKLNNNFALNVYPNPAQNNINIDVIGVPAVDAQVEMINMMGKIVYQKNTNKSHIHIATANLANGIYTIVYKQKEGLQKVKRVIIAK